MKFYFKKSTKYLESKKQMTATILKMIYKAYVCFIKTKKTIHSMAPPIVYGNRNALKSLPIKQIQK